MERNEGSQLSHQALAVGEQAAHDVDAFGDALGQALDKRLAAIENVLQRTRALKAHQAEIAGLRVARGEPLSDVPCQVRVHVFGWDFVDVRYLESRP